MNIWSGGNYLNNTTGLEIGQGVTVTNSNEWASKGDSSFKAVPTGSSSYWYRCDTSYEIENQSILISLKVLNQKYSCQLWVYQLGENNVDLKHESLSISDSDEVQSISLQTTTVTDVKKIRITIQATTNTDHVIYCDDFCFKEV